MLTLDRQWRIHRHKPIRYVIVLRYVLMSWLQCNGRRFISQAGINGSTLVADLAREGSRKKIFFKKKKAGPRKLSLMSKWHFIFLLSLIFNGSFKISQHFTIKVPIKISSIVFFLQVRIYVTVLQTRTYLEQALFYFIFHLTSIWKNFITRRYNTWPRQTARSMSHMITTNTLNGHVNLYLLRLYPCALYSPLLTEKQRVVFPVGNP